FQAAWTSALTFALGASLPVLASCAGFNIAWGAYPAIATVAATSLFALVLLGALAAKTGGAAMARGAIRVAGWGALAMALTCLVGLWIGGPAG
ncbi:MAG: VIT1/CCC1 transporter family protein, partial [Actinomycetota bacterium]